MLNRQLQTEKGMITKERYVIYNNKGEVEAALYNNEDEN